MDITESVGQLIDAALAPSGDDNMELTSCIGTLVVEALRQSTQASTASQMEDEGEMDMTECVRKVVEQAQEEQAAADMEETGSVGSIVIASALAAGPIMYSSDAHMDMTCNVGQVLSQAIMHSEEPMDMATNVGAVFTSATQQSADSDQITMDFTQCARQLAPLSLAVEAVDEEAMEMTGCVRKDVFPAGPQNTEAQHEVPMDFTENVRTIQGL